MSWLTERSSYRSQYETPFSSENETSIALEGSYRYRSLVGLVDCSNAIAMCYRLTH
jgi:hypothetical protein